LNLGSVFVVRRRTLAVVHHVDFRNEILNLKGCIPLVPINQATSEGDQCGVTASAYCGLSSYTTGPRASSYVVDDQTSPLTLHTCKLISGDLSNKEPDVRSFASDTHLPESDMPHQQRKTCQAIPLPRFACVLRTRFKEGMAEYGTWSGRLPAITLSKVVRIEIGKEVFVAITDVSLNEPIGVPARRGCY
jgi:hypothetical protein